MKNLRALAFASACLSLVAAAPAAGQGVESGAEAGRFRFGPLRVTPWIAVTDVGVDSNVFNDANNAKRDFTTAIGPATNFWINLGPSRLRGKTSGQYLFFSKYDNQRSWATTSEGRWEVPLTRVTPFVTGAFSRTRQRPSYEIDSRARQRLHSYGAGTELRLGAKSTVILSGKRTELTFDDDDAVFGSVLAASLNHRTAAEELQFRNELTPLTTFVLRTEAFQDRFEDPIRNAESVRVMAGFELKPLALISGSGFVGFRSFSPANDTIPSYRGIVSSVKAKYSVSNTRIEAQIAKDLDYSFEAKQPYYTLTDLSVTVTERLSHLWDVVGRAGWQSLGYRNVRGAGELDTRLDRGAMFGTGTGYRIGQTLRVGVDLNYFRRDAHADTLHDYTGLRVGGSVTYGMPQ